MMDGCCNSGGEPSHSQHQQPSTPHNHNEEHKKTKSTGTLPRKPKQRPTILIVESMCCHKEVPLVTDLLLAVSGVQKVEALIALRQVAVWHACDGSVLPQQLADELNKGRLGASVYKSGYTPPGKTTPSLTRSAQENNARPGENQGEGPLTAQRFSFLCCGGGGSGSEMPHNFGLYIATFLWLLSYAGNWPDLNTSTSLGFHSLSLVSMVWTLPTVSNRAVLLLRRGVIDINSLMVLAAIGSVAIGDWSEGAAVLALFALGEQLESSATGSARRAIESIVSLQPDEAVVLMSAADAGGSGQNIEGGGGGGGLVGVRTAVDEISVGSLIALRPGDCVPLDCRVVSGSSLIDEASLTGESVPVRKKVGDALSGGTVNIGTGYLEAETTAASEDSAVARLGRLVQQAQMERSPTERTVEKVSRVYTPMVVAMAAIVACIPLILGHENAGHPLDPWYWPRTALVLLVLACPCALVLSTPIAYVSSLAFAARRGILVRGGRHLETLAGLTTLAIDKTGTLTQGSFTVGDFVLLNGPRGEDTINGSIGEEDEGEWSVRVARVMSLVQAAEQGSSHPLAMALIAEAKRRNAPPIIGKVTDVSTIPGKGLRATIMQPTCGNSEEKEINDDRNNKEKDNASNSISSSASKTVVVEIGNTVMATELGWLGQLRMSGELMPPVKQWETRGATVVWVGVDGVPQCVISCADAIRSEAHDAISRLHSLGVSCIMLTGDNQGAAEQVAKMAGLDHFHAGLLPGDKVSWVRAMQQPGFTLDRNSRHKSNLLAKNRRSMLCFRWLNPRWWCRRMTRSGAVRGDEEEGMMSADDDMITSSSPPVSECGVVGMVGDGINDAPALAAAAVGVAMGVKATAVAMETADVALMDSDLCKLSLAVEIGRRCKRRILCNIILAISVKVIFFALALTGNVTLAMATVTDVGGMLLVTLNSVSLLANEGPFDVTQRWLMSLCRSGKRSKEATTYSKLDENTNSRGGGRGGAVVHAVADENVYEYGEEDLEMGGGVTDIVLGGEVGSAATAAGACKSGCCASISQTTDSNPIVVGDLVDVADVVCSDGCCGSEVDGNTAASFVARERVVQVAAAALVATGGDCTRGCCSSGKAVDVVVEPTEAVCSSGCCGGGDDSDKATTSTVNVMVEPTEAACSSGCCGGDDIDKAATSTVNVVVESTEAACSSGFCGSDDSDKAATSTVDAVVAPTEAACSTGCCGGEDDSGKTVDASIDVVAESTDVACSIRCCNGVDSDKADTSVVVAVESTEAVCSSGCCGGDDSDKVAFSTVDFVVESTEAACSSGCCGGDDIDKAATSTVDAVVAPTEAACSSGCCGGEDDSGKTVDASVDVVAESTDVACSIGCCYGVDSDKDDASVVVAVESTKAACLSGCCGGDDSDKTADSSAGVVVEPTEATCSSFVVKPIETACSTGCCRGGDGDKASDASVDVVAESTDAACLRGCCGGDGSGNTADASVGIVVEPAETACSSGCCGDSDKAATSTIDVVSSACCGGDASGKAVDVDVAVESTDAACLSGCCGSENSDKTDDASVDVVFDSTDVDAVGVAPTGPSCSSGCCGGGDGKTIDF